MTTVEDLIGTDDSPRYSTVSGFPEATVDVSGVGPVRVRGLSRLEVLHIQSATNPAIAERRVIAAGMVEPAMTERQAGEWQKRSVAGELEPVTEAIGELSGIAGRADKAAYKSVSG